MAQQLADGIGRQGHEISIWYSEAGSVGAQELGEDLAELFRDPGAFIVANFGDDIGALFDDTWKVQITTVNSEEWKATTIVDLTAILFHGLKLAVLVLQKSAITV